MPCSSPPEERGFLDHETTASENYDAGFEKNSREISDAGVTG